jgi:hypothetical protein
VQWSDADIGDKTLLASLVSAIGVAVMFEAVSKSFTAASA